MSVLGGLASSRLDNILVRSEQLAVHVTAGVQDFAQLGMVEVTADVKPCVDADMVAKRLDAIIADYFAYCPTSYHFHRVATHTFSCPFSFFFYLFGFCFILFAFFF